MKKETVFRFLELFLFPLSQSRESRARGVSSREDGGSEKDAGSREKQGEQRHVDRPHNTSACKAISVRARGGLRHVTASIHSGPYGMVSYESEFFRYTRGNEISQNSMDVTLICIYRILCVPSVLI